MALLKIEDFDHQAFHLKVKALDMRSKPNQTSSAIVGLVVFMDKAEILRFQPSGSF